MPNRDRTGPRSQGSRTGKGLGECPLDKTNTNKISYGDGRGQGIGRKRKNRRLNPMHRVTTKK